MTDHQHGFALRNDPPPGKRQTYQVAVSCTIMVSAEGIDGDDACARAEAEVLRDITASYGRGSSVEESRIEW